MCGYGGVVCGYDAERGSVVVGAVAGQHYDRPAQQEPEHNKLKVVVVQAACRNQLASVQAEPGGGPAQCARSAVRYRRQSFIRLSAGVDYEAQRSRRTVALWLTPTVRVVSHWYGSRLAQVHEGSGRKKSSPLEAQASDDAESNSATRTPVGPRWRRDELAGEVMRKIRHHHD